MQITFGELKNRLSSMKPEEIFRKKTAKNKRYNGIIKKLKKFVKENFKKGEEEEMVEIISDVFGFALEEDNSGQLVLYTDVFPNGNLEEEEDA